MTVLARLFPPLPGMKSYKRKLKNISKVSNDRLFHVVQDVAYAYAAGTEIRWSETDIGPRCQDFLPSLLDNRNDFVFRNQDVLLAALDPNKTRTTPVAQAHQDPTVAKRSQSTLA